MYYFAFSFFASPCIPFLLQYFDIGRVFFLIRYEFSYMEWWVQWESYGSIVMPELCHIEWQATIAELARYR